MYTCEGHKHWVLFVSFSPDCTKIASGGMDHNIIIWNAENGEQFGSPLKGHKNFITSISWEPMISSQESRRMASSSKDQCVRIWDTMNSTCLKSLTSHTASVTKALWGGEGLIYSASQDRTIKVWHADEGIMMQELKGHAHWVNTLALSTDYVLRTGCFDHIRKEFSGPKDMQKYAIERYEKVKDPKGERLVSGSDDLTMFLWQPKQGNKSVARMTGHQGLVNMVAFSPDSFYFASASFDKSIKLWDGRTGKFLTSFRGHVQSVYQISWSSDSRMIVSGSKDSTMKVWDVEKKKLMFDLPGHADEVYAVDWSPDGEKVASGSKDRMLRIWRN
jgi:ribosome assembly protein 4